MLRLAARPFGEEAVGVLREVLESGRLTQGPWVERFEAAIAEYCGVAHAVAVSSGTTALHLALAALDVGPGDEVIVPDFTHPATANVVLQQGATVRLVDVERDTYDVAPEAVEAALSARTRLIIAVDLFGLPAGYGRLEPLARAAGVPLLCDAACSLGATYAGRRCGTIGALSTFSFHPRKVLTTGEGGMVVTGDAALAARMRRLRNHGSERGATALQFAEPGFNYRLSELHAALGAIQVPGHDAVVARRAALAAELTERLRDVPGVTPPAVPGDRTSSWQAYVAVLDPELDRAAVIAGLAERGVEATVGTYALHAEPAFARACGTRPGDLPVSWELAARSLALPLHQDLADADMVTVAEALAAVAAPAPERLRQA